MYSYLSQDKPNRIRQSELDLAKCIAIFLMISCHCGMYFLEPDSPGALFFDLLGGEFAAPVFMVCMGIGVVFSHHNQPRLLISRGTELLLLGYLLNLIRATIPELIVRLINPSLQLFGLFPSFYMVDILPFAGLAMIVMGLFKKWRVEPAYQLLIGLLMAGLGDILAWRSTGYECSDAFCDLFWGANEWSFFPFLNWFIYPAAGVYLGEILMHCNDKTALYKRLLPIGTAGVLLAYYQMFTDYYDYYSNDGSYYFMDIKNVVYGLCFPMLLFSVCYFITEKTRLGDSRFVTYSSKHLNTIYCISWVAILWPRYFGILLAGWKITWLCFFLLLAAVFVASYGLCEIWIRFKRKRAVHKAEK